LTQTSRTIVKDTLSSLIATLDELENVDWAVEVVEDPRYIILQSVMNPKASNRRVQLQIWVQRDSFQITAVRVLESSPPVEKLPELQTADAGTAKQLELPISRGAQAAIIWRTKPRGLQFSGTATFLSAEKSVTADFMGFGEQGGQNLFKKRTYMNYFSKSYTGYRQSKLMFLDFDNMRYQNVYGKGLLDDRAPLPLRTILD
jgi:hypothetical protein